MSFKPVNFDRLARFNSDASSKLLDICENSWKNEIDKNRERIPHKAFAPSSMRCKRRSWFRLRGVSPDRIDDPDTGLDFSARIGTDCHIFLQTLLKKYLKGDWIQVYDYILNNKNNLLYSSEDYGVVQKAGDLEAQISLVNPPVNFACDGVIRINSTIYLLEIKTCEFSVWDDLTEPREEHIEQIKAYGSILGIHNILMIYQDRQYGRIKCYELTLKSSDIDGIKQYFDSVMLSVENNIAPEGLPVGNKWCTPSMCPYYKKCQEYGRKKI